MARMAQCFSSHPRYTQIVKNENVKPLTFQRRLMLTLLAALAIALFHSVSEADEVAQAGSAAAVTQAAVLVK